MPKIVPVSQRRENGYQCDGCLDRFPLEEVTKECECGAYLCKPCKAEGKIACCFCAC